METCHEKCSVEQTSNNKKQRALSFPRVGCAKSIKAPTRLQIDNSPFSYSEKESQSNDTLLRFVEFSNVQNSDRSSNATRSNLVCKNV